LLNQRKLKSLGGVSYREEHSLLKSAKNKIENNNTNTKSAAPLANTYRDDTAKIFFFNYRQNTI
jgi:hypothetical protein